jgi:S1-C subfamily serine protease
VALDRTNRVVSLVHPDSPSNAAGFDQDDVITSVDGRKVPEGASLTDMIRGRKPGDKVTIAYTHPDGRPGSGVVTLAEDPSLEAVPVERTGSVPTAAQRAFRDKWLGSTRR